MDVRRRAVRPLPAGQVLRLQGRAGVQSRRARAGVHRRRGSDVARRPPNRAAPPAGRRRQVRVVRRLPADRSSTSRTSCWRSPSGSTSSSSRRRPRAARPVRSTSCSSRARSATRSSSRSSFASAARRRRSSRSVRAPPPAASRPSATGPSTGRGRPPSIPGPELVAIARDGHARSPTTSSSTPSCAAARSIRASSSSC